jgi:RNA polymerase sigma factor (sigma-70 family)
VYDEALDYFGGAVSREQLLGPEEAEDLAGDCVLEFSRVLDRVRKPEHYARRMFRNNLRRYLRRKRIRMKRESSDADAPVGSSVPDRPALAASDITCRHERFDDVDRRRYHTARRRIERADDQMRQIIRYRLAAEPLPYRVIGEILGQSEPALRMRMTRFCRSVRREFARSEKRRSWRAPDRLPAERRRRTG